MSLLLCGIVVSSLAAPAAGQQRPQGGWNWPDQPATKESWQQTEARNHDFTPPAPRGDLRGDIASNVRTRPEPARNESSRQRAGQVHP
jgi:hypothetical protein